MLLRLNDTQNIHFNFIKGCNVLNVLWYVPFLTELYNLNYIPNDIATHTSSFFFCFKIMAYFNSRKKLANHQQDMEWIARCPYCWTESAHDWQTHCRKCAWYLYHRDKPILQIKNNIKVSSRDSSINKMYTEFKSHAYPISTSLFIAFPRTTNVLWVIKDYLGRPFVWGKSFLLSLLPN